MKYAVWAIVAALLVAHQDCWFWEDSTLVFGFMPVGLLYHVGISIAAGITWYLATVYAWPRELAEAEPPGQEEPS